MANMKARVKKCQDCTNMITIKATRCYDCNAIHMRTKPPVSVVKSNRKIDSQIKPYMLRRGNPDERSIRTGASCMVGGSI